MRLDDGRSPSASNQAGIGLIGVLVTIGILGLLAVLAVKAIPTGKADISGLPPGDLPGGAADIVGGDDSGGGGGAVAGVPNGLIAQAADQVAQENLRTTLSVADQVAADLGGFGAITASTLEGAARGASFTAGPSTSASQIGVAAAGGSGGGLTLAVRSASGTCWFIWASNSATWYGVQTGRPSCAAPALATAPTGGALANSGIDWESGSFPQG